MSGTPSAAAHLVHGMGTALEAPTWPAITPSEAEMILTHFPVAGRLVGLRWHSPRPFSAAALVHTSRGEFFLKRHHVLLRTPSGLAEEHRFISHLHGAGLQVPEVMTASDGSGAIAVGEWSYELHRKSAGADLYRDRASWTPFLSVAHARAAGIALAQLHLAARRFVAPRRRPQPLVASLTILSADDPMAATEAYVAARPALSDFLAGRAWRADYARILHMSGDGLSKRLASQTPLWTHNDWHPSNLLWTPEDSVRTIIDFGLADRTCAIHDLTLAIERTAIRWLSLSADRKDALADTGSALALLQGYNEVAPLSAADVQTIVQLLPLVHVEFALSEVDYFHGILADDDHAALAWDSYLLSHAEWFRSPSGQDLLGHIANLARI